MNAQAILRAEARHRWPADYHQVRIWNMHVWLRWGLRRVRALYNGEASVALREHEVLRLLEIEEAQRRRDARNEANEVRHDTRNLHSRLARLEARLAQIDPDFFSPEMDALSQTTDGGGASDGVEDVRVGR